MTRVNITPPAITDKHIETFWSRVDKSPGQGPFGDCWIWTGRKTQGRMNYGHITVKCREIYTHRFSYFIATGIWTELFVLHRCDNPPCVNPSHMFLGTHQDNSDDKMAKGRNVVVRYYPTRAHGTKIPHAKLTDEKVRQARQWAADGTQLKEIAALIGVHPCVISRVVRRLAWAHVE